MKDGTETRRRIQAEALRMFAEKGVDATSTRDIARAAGIADSALYRHYRSKDDLVWDLFSTNYADYGRRLAEATAEGPARDRIDRAVREVCRRYDEDPALFNFLLLMQHGFLGRVADGPDNPVSVLCAVIAEGVARGEIRPGDPTLMAAMVMGVVLQPATFKLYGRIADRFEDLADALSAGAWRVLAP